MTDVLDRLYAEKARSTALDMQREDYATVVERGLQRRGERRSFRAALHQPDRIALIAEIKRASPSVGVIEPNFDPAVTARKYQAVGVDAISVLTETSAFGGDLRNLDIARSGAGCPILRKDFLTQPYEIAQSAAYGADAVLLIVAGLSDQQLQKLLAEAQRFALDALVEVHSIAEGQRAVAVGATIIGINNRDLRTFGVDLQTTEIVAPTLARNCTLVTESGIAQPEHIKRALQSGVQAALIGEAAMRAPDLADFFQRLRAVRVA